MPAKLTCLLLTFLAGLCAGAMWLGGDVHRSEAFGQQPSSRPDTGQDDWLAASPDPQRDQLERHLRGLDVAMMEIGFRFNELHFAGIDRNWPYAQYQIEKIELALKLALERRPKRAQSSEPFLRETIPFVKNAIEAASKGDEAQSFPEVIEQLRADCMKCHVEENVPHFTVYPNKTRTSVVLTGEDSTMRPH